ncbi:hypothetical protein BI067_gp15 [Escherichia phage 64795_ec1]|uniref:Uncharacterized protein n=1 Tax=Escherichia phage 64795_ec1 TaxID=1837842 RepID=A0A192Y936_9CAUD|nr:hypothetical protein BI067_gp15 [Escherichia phage 64795_ec1]ANM45740.1 hypothetical protein [Escherichia phage 64795_ec1]
MSHAIIVGRPMQALDTQITTFTASLVDITSRETDRNLSVPTKELEVHL